MKDKNKGKAPSECQKMSLSFSERESYMWNYLEKQFNPRYYVKTLVHEDMVRKGIINDRGEVL